MSKKVSEWVKRYLPAEILGIIGTIIAGFFVHHFSTNKILVSYGAIVGEGCGYYGYISITDFLRHKKTSKTKTKAAFKLGRDMFLEFSLAEYLDTIFVRPAAIYLFISILPNFIFGLILGKLAGDIFFYALTIPSYELRKKLFRG